MIDEELNPRAAKVSALKIFDQVGLGRGIQMLLIRSPEIFSEIKRFGEQNSE